MNVQQPTGQWFVAGDGQRWWFDSGSIAFDFAYTGGFPGPQDVTAWWRERCAVEVPVSATDYTQARELRQMIAQAVIATSYGRPVPGEA